MCHLIRPCCILGELHQVHYKFSVLQSDKIYRVYSDEVNIRILSEAIAQKVWNQLGVVIICWRMFVFQKTLICSGASLLLPIPLLLLWPVLTDDKPSFYVNKLLLINLWKLSTNCFGEFWCSPLRGRFLFLLNSSNCCSYQHLTSSL